MAGAGVDECVSDESCRYRACVEGYCIETPGDGMDDQCSSDSECSHFDCYEGFCLPVPGRGPNLCGSHSQCGHSKCRNGTCIRREGPGENECLVDEQCPGYRKCKADDDGFPYCGRSGGIGEDECLTSLDCWKALGLAERKAVRLADKPTVNGATPAEVKRDPIKELLLYSNSKSLAVGLHEAPVTVAVFQDLKCGM